MKSLASPTRTKVVSLSGHISASNATHFRERLNQSLLLSSPVELVLDMSQVEFLDSAGLMVLVNTLAAAQKRDSNLALCCIPPSVQIILELTQLNRAFTVLESRPTCNAATVEAMAIAA
ncbi:MAG: STAS domain-containing protein [Cyanobacteria bacterium P01_F01_bin.150]